MMAEATVEFEGTVIVKAGDLVLQFGYSRILS